MIDFLRRPSSTGEGGECVRQYLGKFRGIVENNVDPLGQGRILVTVPEVSPLMLLNWARPCTPVGGPQHGMFAVPPPKAEVWIEFESGDLDYPLWVGCVWGGSVEVPRKAPVANPLTQAITLQTPTQHSVVIDDAPGSLGGIQITTRLRQKILLTDTGIEIDNGFGASIRMVGPTIEINAAKVSINRGALEVI
jgi:uncharacterized protein involved in type VI secretion and phage assembly